MNENNKTVIVDYGMGNIRSIEYKLQKRQIPAFAGSDHKEILSAARLILPGVGHFGRAMEMLARRELIEPLTEAVCSKGIPVFGICLGMQLMTNGSEEGGVEGLGWFSGKTVKFDFSGRDVKPPVPHVGWQTIARTEPVHPLLMSLPSDVRFYFTHSYVVIAAHESGIAATCNYKGYDFAAAIQGNSLFGTQFHPEKSHRSGFELLLRFAQGGRE